VEGGGLKGKKEKRDGEFKKYKTSRESTYYLRRLEP